jgi:hypothetical protein
MTARPASTRQSLGDYVDQVALEEAFLTAHPDAKVSPDPDWTFTRQLGGWQAKQTDGSELKVARTLKQVEAGVAQQERNAASAERGNQPATL